MTGYYTVFHYVSSVSISLEDIVRLYFRYRLLLSQKFARCSGCSFISLKKFTTLGTLNSNFAALFLSFWFLG